MIFSRKNKKVPQKVPHMLRINLILSLLILLFVVPTGIEPVFKV